MRGFLLIEILLYMGLVVLLISTLSLTLAQLSHSSQEASTQAATLEATLIMGAQTNRLIHDHRE